LIYAITMASIEGSNPHFMAPSPTKGDIFNALSQYFGPPARPELEKNYSDQNAATYNFPEAFIGQSTQLQATISSLIYKPQTWQTTVALPLRSVQGVHVEWNEVKFNEAPLGRTPNQGTSRLLTASKRRYQDRLVRRGIALLLESDFFSTPEGQRHFAEQLKSIANCVQETMNMDVIFKLISTKNYDLEFTRDSLVQPQLNLHQVYKHTVDMFAILQKMDDGLDYAVEQSKSLMLRYGVEADTFIIPPEVSLYMALVPDRRKIYMIGGAQAPAEFNAGAKGFETDSFRNMGVVVNRPLDSMGNLGPDSQALRREVAIGEYYRVDFNEIKDGSETIYIYDENKDDLVALTKDQLEKASLADAWKTNFNDDDPVFYVCRPFITHDMYSAIMMKSGGAAGYTLFGESNFQFAGNVDVKNIHGHYTAYFNSVVTDPKQIKTLRDISCAGYVSGCNTDFFGTKSDGTYDGNSIADALLDFRQMDPNERQASGDKSILVFCAKRNAKQTQVISISSVAFPWDSSRNGISEESGQNFPGGKENFEWYNQTIKTTSGNYTLNSLIIGGRNPDVANTDPLIRADASMNTICFRGPVRYVSKSLEKMVLIPGKGHFGADAQPGDASWRNGQMRSLREARAMMQGSSSASDAIIARVPV
jgi:hypothetical protein